MSALGRFLANRMHVTTIELDSSHVSLISHPKEIANLILQAAGYSVTNQGGNQDHVES